MFLLSDPRVDISDENCHWHNITTIKHIVPDSGFKSYYFILHETIELIRKDTLFELLSD
jgi:hypothetical protein